jgi:hypothetical protein
MLLIPATDMLTSTRPPWQPRRDGLTAARRMGTAIAYMGAAIYGPSKIRVFYCSAFCAASHGKTPSLPKALAGSTRLNAETLSMPLTGTVVFVTIDLVGGAIQLAIDLCPLALRKFATIGLAVGTHLIVDRGLLGFQFGGFASR